MDVDVVVFVGGVRSRIRLFVRALIFVGLIWFMFVAAISMNVHQTKRNMVLIPLHVMSKNLKLVSMQRHSLHYSNSGMVFVSNRKVPNGPDPIHNRRAVKFKQPPTQA